MLGSIYWILYLGDSYFLRCALSSCSDENFRSLASGLGGGIEAGSTFTIDIIAFYFSTGTSGSSMNGSDIALIANLEDPTKIVENKTSRLRFIFMLVLMVFRHKLNNNFEIKLCTN